LEFNPYRTIDRFGDEVIIPIDAGGLSRALATFLTASSRLIRRICVHFTRILTTLQREDFVAGQTVRPNFDSIFEYAALSMKLGASFGKSWLRAATVGVT
jgi:hypothetical protein